MGSWHYLRDYRAWAFLLVITGLTLSAVALRYALVKPMTAEEVDVTTYTTKWTDANGKEQVVETERKVDEGETPEQHAARHAANVAALEAEFPPG